MAEPNDRDLASARRPRIPKDTATRLRILGQQKLMADLKSMVNDAEKSDVVFRCSDGEAVHASRWLLANRCNVFEGMFRNGTVESTLSEVPLPTISSRVMLSVVEFLYSGTLDSYPLLDWKMGFEMERAGEFFMIQTLKEIAKDYLERMASKACLDEEQDVLMRMLSVALEFQEGRFAKELLLEKLVSNIHVDWFAPSYSCELSRTAVDHILCKSRKRLKHGRSHPDMEEYCILRNIVLWHVHQVTNDEKVHQIATKLLPRRQSVWKRMRKTDENENENENEEEDEDEYEYEDEDDDEKMLDVDSFLSAVSVPVDSRDSTAVINSSLGVQLQKESLDQMLERHVNLSCIPASLLLTVIDPLKMFRPGQLLKAVVHGSLTRRVHKKVFRSDFLYHSSGTNSIKIEGDGYILCENENRETANTVVVRIPEPRTSSHAYGWKFAILQHDATSIDVGFVGLRDADRDKVNDIVKKSLQDFSETRIVRIDTKKQRLGFCSDEPKSNLGNWNFHASELRTNLEVRFYIFDDDSSCLCTVWAAGENVIEAHLKIPHHPNGVYFPAVSFNGCLSGKVQFQLLDGFDYHEGK